MELQRIVMSHRKWNPGPLERSQPLNRLSSLTTCMSERKRSVFLIQCRQKKRRGGGGKKRSKRRRGKGKRVGGREEGLVGEEETILNIMAKFL